MNQSEQEESISISDREEYKAEEKSDERKDSTKDYNFPDQQYIVGPVVGMVFSSVEFSFALYREHSHLNGFAVVKKS